MSGDGIIYLQPRGGYMAKGKDKPKKETKKPKKDKKKV
jgi:hypothetical protein